MENNNNEQNNNSLLSKLDKSFKSQMSQATQKLVQQYSLVSAIMNISLKTKEAISELKDLDTLLRDIGKTNSQFSKSELEKIGNASFDIASKYGKTATDYLSDVQDAAHAGYTNVKEIAELSLAVQNAGNMTAELANQYIAATDKAFEMNGSIKALSTTLDGANNIANNNLVDMTDLAEAMSIVGSQAANSGMKVDETTAAIATMIAVTNQSGSEMAKAFQGILMNLQQVTGEVNDGGAAIDTKSLAKYKKACEELGVSLSIVKGDMVSLKEPMQIIGELSEAYTKLDDSDAKRTNLLNAVGGGNRATALNALLENYDLYEKMFQEYTDGLGSMDEAANITAHSWEGSLNRISNTWTDTVENVANSDAIITLLNGFNGVLSVINNVTDALGSLGTISVASGLLMSLKGIGKRTVFQWQFVLRPLL